MKRLTWLVVVLMAFIGVPSAQAGDVISPPVLTYSVVAGESFEFDLSFLSESGGEYDILVKTFRFDEEGRRRFEEGAAGVLELNSEVIGFDKGENAYVPVRVQIPDDAQDGDLMYQIGFRIRGNSFHSYELSSVVLLSVGEVDGVGRFETAAITMGEAEGSILGVDYVFQNQGDRFLVATPQLLLMRNEVEELYTGKAQVFFPVKQDQLRFSFFDDDSILFDESVSSVAIRMLSSEKELLDEVQIEDFSFGELHLRKRFNLALVLFERGGDLLFCITPHLSFLHCSLD